jgi:predicted transglutaminase-like cysteine proteinase
MGVVSRRLMTVLVAAATLCATAAQAQVARMDALPRLLATRVHEPFGRSTDFAPAGPLWVKWRTFESDLAKNDEEIARCRAEPASCSRAALTLVALIDEARTLDGRRQLGIVNRSLNLAIAYTSDMAMHGVSDVWSSPLSTLESGRGDCEDYAIAKMFVLRAAGVAVDDLRLLIAHNYSDGSAHAVLAVRHDGRWLLLDNRRMALLEDVAVRDLQPLFTLDVAGVRQFGAPTTTLVAAAKTQATPASGETASGGDLLPLLM